LFLARRRRRRRRRGARTARWRDVAGCYVLQGWT
jgi:hypothetical protein